MVGAQCKYHPPATLTLAFFSLFPGKIWYFVVKKKKKKQEKGSAASGPVILRKCLWQDFLGGLRLRIRLPMEGTQVQSLVRELRSHVQPGH